MQTEPNRYIRNTRERCRAKNIRRIETTMLQAIRIATNDYCLLVKVKLVSLPETCEFDDINRRAQTVGVGSNTQKRHRLVVM